LWGITKCTWRGKASPVFDRFPRAKSCIRGHRRWKKRKSFMLNNRIWPSECEFLQLKVKATLGPCFFGILDSVQEQTQWQQSSVTKNRQALVRFARSKS